MNLAHLFKEQKIKFGTSGIRADNDALSNDCCYSIALAFLAYLEENKLSPERKLALAGDLRATTDRITYALSEALKAKGYQNLYLGKIPTPALAYYCEKQGCAGIMVTGSHIQENMNGLKFYHPQGEILKSDEEKILAQVVEWPQEPLPGGLPGRASPAGRESYLQRYLDFFPAGTLDGLKLGVYQHSSVATPILIEMLEKLGATVLPFGESAHFQSVDTENLTAADIRLAQEACQSQALDALVSTDGDGDRPLLADETGQWLKGDILGMLTALILKADYLVVPVTCNSSIDHLSAFSGILRTKVGSPYVIEGIQALLQQGKKRILGYEANGGLLLGSDFSLQGKQISALSTRDGLLPSLCILAHLNKNKLRLSQLAKQHLIRFTWSSSLKNFPVEDLSPEDMQNLLQQIYPARPIAKLPCIDGARFSFDNGDLIHLRPSGNSPELRCYTEAGSEERALELNQKSLNLLKAWRLTFA